jgi:hypothetical protein
LEKIFQSLSKNKTADISIYKNTSKIGPNITKLLIECDDKETSQSCHNEITIAESPFEVVTDIKYAEDYPLIIIMESDVFTKVIKNFKGTYSTIRFLYSNDKFTIEVQKDQSKQSRNFMASKTFIYKQKPKDVHQIIEGICNIKMFDRFISKCSKLSTIIKLYLSNINPLIIEYDIDDLGVFQIHCTLNQSI